MLDLRGISVYRHFLHASAALILLFDFPLKCRRFLQAYLIIHTYLADLLVYLVEALSKVPGCLGQVLLATHHLRQGGVFLAAAFTFLLLGRQVRYVRAD